MNGRDAAKAEAAARQIDPTGTRLVVSVFSRDQLKRAASCGSR